MQRGWRIGRIGGVEIRVDPSLAIIAALIAFNLWATFSDRSQYPETSPAVAGGVALLTTLLFFGSILAHELAHAAFRSSAVSPWSGSRSTCSAEPPRPGSNPGDRPTSSWSPRWRPGRAWPWGGC